MYAGAYGSLREPTGAYEPTAYGLRPTGGARPTAYGLEGQRGAKGGSWGASRSALLVAESPNPNQKRVAENGHPPGQAPGHVKYDTLAPQERRHARGHAIYDTLGPFKTLAKHV